MEKAKQAVSDFMSKSGHHDTTVHERVAPAVTRTKVNPQRHEEAQTAIDKEFHQDHYHTSVQPVQDREVLPEQHTHNLAPVEHRRHEHGNEQEVKQRLQQEASQFKDEHVRGETRHTQGTAPTVAGEHIHHHVHETIQPVVQKEVVEPHVVHTTVPVHEVHHNAAQHHSTSALPAVNMADFKKQGGVLGGREERYDGFEGEPHSIGKSLGGASGEKGFSNSTTGSGMTGTGASYTSTGTSHSGTGTGAGIGARSGVATGAAGVPRSGNNIGAGSGSGSGTGVDTDSGGIGSEFGNQTKSTGQDKSVGDRDSTSSKPSLLQRLNPLADADGDGKKGFMD